MPTTPPYHPLTYTHSYVNTQRQAVPLWVSAAERKLLNNWQWWAARSQSETNLKRSARDVNSTHINYHQLLACLHHSTDWQLDSTLNTVGYGDFGFRFAVVTMSNTCSHKCQVAALLRGRLSRACLLWLRCSGRKGSEVTEGGWTWTGGGLIKNKVWGEEHNSLATISFNWSSH